MNHVGRLLRRVRDMSHSGDAQDHRNILTIHTSDDGRKSWRKFDVQMEVSGYHHNVAYDFLSLRPAIYAAGEGTVRFRNFTYEALP